MAEWSKVTTKASGYSRRSFLAALGLLTLGRGDRARAEDAKWCLAVGDWGWGSVDQKKVARQMAEAAASVGARFVISTGDNFYPRGVKSVRDQKWQTSFEDIYDAPSLRVPWYVALGNHDHHGNVEAQVAYTKQSPRWRMPAAYYKHTETVAENCVAEFFFIDTEPMRRQYDRSLTRYLANNQLLWLAHELASSVAQWKIVVGHHPVFSGGSHQGTPALEAWVAPLLERHGVQVYLSGHSHALEHIALGSVHYLISGAGAEPRRAKAVRGTRFAAGERLGFLLMGFTPTELKVEFRDEAGISLHRARINRTS